VLLGGHESQLLLPRASMFSAANSYSIVTVLIYQLQRCCVARHQIDSFGHMIGFDMRRTAPVQPMAVLPFLCNTVCSR
jgi:hypothetical protein